MRKITLLIASLFITMGAMAQGSTETRFTADELNNLTEKTAIVIRCVQNTNYNTYYDGSGRSAGFTIDKVFYWTPVEDGTVGKYYIMNGDGQYMQQPTGVNATDFYTFGEKDGAAELYAVKPVSGGTPNVNSFSEFNLIYDGNADYIVRIALTDNSRWMNINKLSTTGTGIWTVQNVYDAGKSIVPTWKESALATLGYVGGYALDLKDEIEAVETIEDMIEFETTNVSTSTVSTDAYYRIVCVSPKAENGDTNYKTLAFNGDANLVTTLIDNSNVNQIFRFEDAGDGKFYLKNLNADGYLNKISQSEFRSAIVTKADACKLELLSYGNAQWRLHNSESTNDKHCLFAENHATEPVPYACSGWENGANSASAWYIVEAKDVEMNVNEYATVFLPFAVKVENATACAVTEIATTYVTLTEKVDIPANQGAILKGNGVAKLSIIDETTTDWTGNLLEGTTYTTNIAKEAYVLFDGDGGVGLYVAEKNQEDGTAFKNWANKAYLPKPAGANVVAYSFRFGEGTTAIDKITEQGAESKVIFDLTGRRVEAVTVPGIYIVNGKKVLVK